MLKKISKFTIVYKKLIINFLTHLPDTKEKSEAFGSSLLLSNSPLSPKVVNGSFAAIFDADEFLAKTYAGIRIAVSKMQVAVDYQLTLSTSPKQHQESPSTRRRVRGILMSGKQFSLDSHMDVAVVRTTLDDGEANSCAVRCDAAGNQAVGGQASIREDVDNEESAAEGMKHR